MTFKNTLQRYRLALGKFLFDTEVRQINLDQLNNLNSFLFLRQDGKIGDAIVSSFVFREIKKHNPNAFIGVVCTRKNQFLFQNNPFIDKVFIVAKRSILSRIFLGVELRKYKFDVLFNLTVLLRNRELLFTRIIGAKRNVGYCKSSYKLFNVNLESKELHFSDIYKIALNSLGMKDVNTQYEIIIDLTAKNEVDKFLEDNQLSNYIAVNLFGAGRNRCFDEKKSKALLHYLSEHTDKDIVVLTYPEVTEILEKWLGDLQSSRLYLFKTTSKIDHSIEIIKWSSLVITPDTSIVHIASAFEKPLVAFYNSVDSEFLNWHPNNKAVTQVIRLKSDINQVDFSQISQDFFK